METERDLMHIGATALFEPGSWIDERGEIDEARYLRYAERCLQRLPKWRERVQRVPLVRHPVLVANAGFDLSEHVQFVHLRGGALRDVEAIAAERYSEMLRRDRPLWEITVVDGLRDRRFATIIKLHHCMADGIAGLGSLIAMLDPSPDPAVGMQVPQTIFVQPPRPAALLRAELRRRAAEPLALWRSARRAIESPGALRHNGRSLASGLWSAARISARPAPKTPLNPRRIGKQRAYRGVRLDLEDVKRVRRAADVKLNDVVLAVVASALDRHFHELGARVGTRELRCMVPVSLHGASNGDLFGNEVSFMLVPLPLGQMSARERLARIAESSRRAKHAGQSAAFAIGERFADWTLAPLIPWAARAAMAIRPFNIIVTNIPGPSVPFYLGDAELVGVYPLVPLYRNQALAIALVSYAGSLFWGLNADPDRIPDLGSLAEMISRAFAELRDQTLR